MHPNFTWKVSPIGAPFPGFRAAIFYLDKEIGGIRVSCHGDEQREGLMRLEAQVAEFVKQYAAEMRLNTINPKYHIVMMHDEVQNHYTFECLHYGKTFFRGSHRTAFAAAEIAWEKVREHQKLVETSDAKQDQ